MTPPRTTNQAAGPGGGRSPTAKVALAIGVGAALAIGAGAGIYGALLASRPKPPSATMPDPAALERAAPVVGNLVGQFRPGFQHARCIAVSHAGELLITGDSAIRRFDATGRKLAEIATTQPPGAVAADAAGNVYATFGDKVRVFDPSGEPSAEWPARDKAVFTSIAVGQGEVYVADAGGRCVIRYDTGGRVLGVIGRRDESRGLAGLVIPSPYFDVATAPDGLIRVVNPGRHKIEAYTPAGDREAAWGFFSAVEPGGFVGCCNPANFAVIPAQSAKPGEFAGYVTTEKGLARVKVFDADGTFVGLLAPAETFKRHDELVAARPSGQPFEALDVAAGHDGRIYVLDGAVGDVRVYEWRKEKDPRAEGAETQRRDEGKTPTTREAH